MIHDLFDFRNLDPNFVEIKPWGTKYNLYTDHFTSTDVCWVKAGGHCSWHFHEHQYNAFFVLSGRLKIIREYKPESSNKVIQIIGTQEEHRRAFIHPLHKHKFIAHDGECVFVEMGNVRYSKDDIFRDQTDLGGLDSSLREPSGQ